MGLIDSHAHLTFPELIDQVEAVLERALLAGVEHVVTIGTTPADSRQAVDLANRYPRQVSATIGIHPHEAEKITESDMAALGDLLEQPGVVGIGELGLDYHYDFAARKAQRRVFAGQLALAADRGLPLVIHAREALDDTIEMLIDHGFADRPAVFHCFTGTAEEAVRIAERGWRVSFTGIVTFAKSGWLQEIARDYPAEKLMVETDSPYLSPVPVRNKYPNEPAHVAHTARFLAKLRGVPYEKLVDQTCANTRRFFGL